MKSEEILRRQLALFLSPPERNGLNTPYKLIKSKLTAFGNDLSEDIRSLLSAIEKGISYINTMAVEYQRAHPVIPPIEEFSPNVATPVWALKKNRSPEIINNHDSEPFTAAALIGGVTMWFNKQARTFDTASQNGSLWTYLFGAQHINIAVEAKDIKGIGVSAGNATSSKIRVNVGPVSIAGEQSNGGRRQFDIRVGARPGGVGVVVRPGEEKIFRPYGRLGWMQLRIKFYPDHVSLKVESTSRIVNGMGRSTEIRMSKSEWAELKNILKTKGEREAAEILRKKYGIRVNGIRRLTSVAHGASGFLGELALFWGVGKIIDHLADEFDFDPNFKGRGLVQVGSTLAIVEAMRTLWHKYKTGELPNNLKQRLTCATIDTAATLMAFDMVGYVIDGAAQEHGFRHDFFGRTILQFIGAFAVVLSAKKTFEDSPVGQMCSAARRSDESEAKPIPASLSLPVFIEQPTINLVQPISSAPNRETTPVLPQPPLINPANLPVGISPIPLQLR